MLTGHNGKSIMLARRRCFKQLCSGCPCRLRWQIGSLNRLCDGLIWAIWT